MTKNYVDDNSRRILPTIAYTIQSRDSSTHFFAFRRRRKVIFAATEEQRERGGGGDGKE